MTNTLHRRGLLENLQNDYVIFTHATWGINKEGSAPKLRQFMRICLKYHPVNMGDITQGTIVQDDIETEKLIASLTDTSSAAAVFTDIETLHKVIEELIQADLGISINISGLMEGVRECCGKAGIQRHSGEHSLGIWGARDRLPEREILEFNTLCGHGMVSFNLIRKVIEQVKQRRLTPKKGARLLAKCCECGVFNPARAEILLERVQKKGLLVAERRGA